VYSRVLNIRPSFTDPGPITITSSALTHSPNPPLLSVGAAEEAAKVAQQGRRFGEM